MFQDKDHRSVNRGAELPPRTVYLQDFGPLSAASSEIWERLKAVLMCEPYTRDDRLSASKYQLPLIYVDTPDDRESGYSFAELDRRYREWRRSGNYYKPAVAAAVNGLTENTARYSAILAVLSVWSQEKMIDVDRNSIVSGSAIQGLSVALFRPTNLRPLLAS